MLELKVINDQQPAAPRCLGLWNKYWERVMSLCLSAHDDFHNEPFVQVVQVVSGVPWLPQVCHNNMFHIYKSQLFSFARFYRNDAITATPASYSNKLTVILHSPFHLTASYFLVQVALM